jgi:drug/metabolite transporter (DMT)-like permease
MFSALFAFLMLNERLSPLGIVGGILIFLGLIVSELLEFFRQRGAKLSLPERENVTLDA